MSKKGTLSWAELNKTKLFHFFFIHWLLGQEETDFPQYHSLPLPSFSPTSSFPFVSFPLPCSPQTCINETQKAKGALRERGKEWEKVSTSLLPLLRSKPAFALAGRLASFMPYPTCLGMALPLAHFLFSSTLEGSFRVGPWTISSAGQIPPSQHLCLVWSDFLSTSPVTSGRSRRQETVKEVSFSTGPWRNPWFK